MNGQNVGYIRVSSESQNTDRQLSSIELDVVFEEKLSGKNTDRPELKRCLSHLRAGDVFHVHSIDRLARSLKDLQDIVQSLTSKGVTIKFHKENMVFEGNNNPMQILMFQMLGAFAEFERNLINSRCNEGRIEAKKNGVKFGAPEKLTSVQIGELKKMIGDGANISLAAKHFNISRPTVYKIIKGA